ncbi:PAAR domain-containing protein [Caballeronia humi]|uniref:PAAR repeat-containing protein n=1 Tax=Caballeronia humi TaxID=326474 RepID=A0A158IW73_9BURK|nr:PAAR domain-containing protein [Caballeronia humi]SAL60725.1 PAAR repeat-containing protein [Caballeronia humi]
MTQRPVCIGDSTTHGGKVIEATSTFSLDGKKVALEGDLVSCPEHGTNPIIEGGSGYIENGRALVVHHCRTQCGSLVIARNNVGMTIA